MFKKILEICSNEISGENAKNLATEITRFHRIQVSPHFREAAHWCRERLEDWGLEARVCQFVSDGKTEYWSLTPPEEWKVESARLDIERKTWADFRDNKISLIQRSQPCDIEADVVCIESADEEAFKNARGKIVYSSFPWRKLKDLAIHYQAAGIITSSVIEFPSRTKLDIPDATHYHAFWGEKGSGFILSPREGERLKKMAEKKQLRAKMKIESASYPGHIDVVEALIKGKREEEVIVLAHLCHPQPSANDNASGSGVLLEVARIIQNLIEKKTLEKPERSIRFLLVPEMSGTIVYFASREETIRHAIAGINLDMVGENQELCKSTLILERTPNAMPSFVNDLAEIILEELTMDVEGLSETTRFASFRHAVTPFSGGSDHLVLSDPSVGIPCPMLIQWPDLFWHCSQDTPEKIDPEQMERVARLTATYAYFLASAKEKEALWFAGIMCEKAKERMSRAARKIMTEKDPEMDAHKFFDHILNREILALLSLKRLADIDTGKLENELKNYAFDEKAKFAKRKEGEKERCGWVPKRIFKGPVSPEKIFLHMPFEEKRDIKKRLEDFESSEILGELAVFWSDGKRTLSEIDECIKYETGRSSLEFLKFYFQFLEKHGLIEIKK